MSRPCAPGSRRRAAQLALMSARTVDQRSGSVLYGRVEADALDDVAVAAVQLGRDLLGLADDGERVEDLVVDEVAHLDPLALLGQAR